MKKTVSLFLALAMALALCSPALAASLPELTFDLSGEIFEEETLKNGSQEHTVRGSIENALEYVNTGDEITVYYTISADSPTEAIATQNEIYYDHNFFELVPNSASASSDFSKYYAVPQTRSGDRHFVFFNTVTPYTYGEAKCIGSFTLKVIATEGFSVITNTSCGAAQNSDKYSIETRDLWVGFGEWDGATFRVTLDVGDGALPQGVSSGYSINAEKGEKLTLPTPTRLFYTFDYWTDGSKQYKAGAQFTPTDHTTLTAHWTAVPAPAAPTGLTAVKTSKPGAEDGKITGVTAAMEYSTSQQSRFTACSGTTINGLSAGTYYVRYSENEAANTPAGQTTAVQVEAWPLRPAPTGLSAVRTSLPDAADGRIIGTTTQMEYSLTEEFTSTKRCSNEITGLRTGTYYIRFISDEVNHIAASAPAAVKVDAWQLRDAPTGLRGFKTSLPEAADGKITGTTTQMEYSLTPDQPTSFKQCTDKEMTGLKAGTYFIRYTFDTVNNKAASVPAEVKVPGGNAPEEPKGLNVEAASAPESKDGKITSVSSLMEYSTKPDFTGAVSCSGTEITGLGAGSYYVRVKANPATNTPPSNYVVITVPAVPAKPTGLAVEKTSAPNKNDGKIKGVNTTMEYSTKQDFSDAKTCPDGDIKGLPAGTYYVRVKANPATNTPAGNYAAVEVPKGNAPAGGGGGGGTPPAGAASSDLTVQATVSEDAVATVSAVSDAEIKAAAATESGVVGIDLSDGEEVESAKLPAGMIGKIASAVNGNGKGGFALKLTSANLEFDMKALQSLANQAKSGELQIDMRDTGTMALNAAQVGAIKGMSIFGGYNVSAAVGKQNISQFNGGNIRISIPFNIPSGRYADGFSAYYVAPDGKLTRLATTYEGGMINFTVNHFSDYIIAYSEQNSFIDVVPGAYYEDAVAWAVKCGITTGTTPTTFGPNDGTTRAQVVTFLWRAAGKPTVDYEMNFRDVPSGYYYTEAVRWAVSKGITDGTSADTFSPNAVCTRAQIVTFLWRASDKPVVDYAMNFRDVASDYYTEAVRWAVSKGITSGKTPTTFAPNATCTRAEVVTFLWRCMK